MAIDAYTGLPRSGKSYSVVKNVIMPSLKEGRHVYTNIPLTQEANDLHPGLIHQLEKDWFSDTMLFEKFPPGAVVVLDELWRRWPSGLKANNAIFEDKEFLAEHGHNVDEFGRTTRVVLVTQDLSQIASFVRDLVDKTYRTTKLDAVGMGSKFRVDIYQGSVTGQRPPKSLLISSMFDKYSETVWRYYKSSTKSQTGDVGNESRADKRSTVWRSPGLIATFAFSAFALIVGPIMLYSYVSDKLPKEPEPQPAAPQLVNPPPPPAAAQQSRPAVVIPTVTTPALSGNWRVAGIIRATARAPRDDSINHHDGSNSAHWLDDMVLLTSMFGNRYVPLTQCTYYPGGVQVYCDVDGERVTSWSGQQSVSSIAPNPVEVASTVAAPFERSETSSGDHVAPTAPRVNVVPDNSRTPRTLLDTDPQASQM